MIAAWALSLAVGIASGVGPDADRAAYEDARSRAGRDADAQVDLALWCESRGMGAEKTTHLTRAVLLDPDHARARGLLGYVKHEGRWLRPDEIARAVEGSPERQALLREYVDRRSKARDDADGQYRLALWCEEKGLTQPMVAHLHRVVQLDPGREGAWRRLGFEKVKGRWVNPEAEAALKAGREGQAQADKAWKPRLEKLRSALSSKDKAKRIEAQERLAAITDPRAVPMLWQVFVQSGDERRQRVAVDVLSRIEAPSASAALALIAVFSPHADLRSDAARLLQQRDPREFAGLLAGLIRDEVRYKVKPVEGPGSQGGLFIEGKDANVQRRYTPMQQPAFTFQDRIGVDDYGNLVVKRSNRVIRGEPILGLSPETFTPEAYARDPAGSLAAAGFVFNTSPANAFAAFQAGGVPAPLSRDLAQRLTSLPKQVAWLNEGPPNVGKTVRPIYIETLEASLEALQADAKASALVARDQLASDVRQIEAMNAPIRDVNERSVVVLKAVSGLDIGCDREKWADWVVDLQGYGLPLRYESQPPPTIVEDVPIAYQPQALVIPSYALLGFRIGPSCFAGGTPVRTLRGPRPIEQIRPGDQVLTQDTTTGRLGYQPVVEVMHNPPNWTYSIDLGTETVHPTGIHRFWKAGHGWIMARDVRPGDRLRTVGGVVEVVSADKEKVQPVFNLLLSGGDNYCVGEAGVIAHDNGFVEPVEKPFDGVPALASTGKP
ncbi:polymorphic toxin-type HINT domain-containing protein [Paludisphaera mucosa]|uniref:Polymorphic toxin-type HINT domain-containing protein n=1 Tax=Paludisphaera mucosa TaxID=3030827 RepID=A0ABT6F9Z2_9BACT|nr:polymorphic toxin-type HINT domain-containing protein [Paludisphaera mucosa]MDG3004213.1 polymorphic toxin-type HINT domain-containing protein [Paludisphaera mucosa]